MDINTTLNLIGRNKELFDADMSNYDKKLREIVSLSSFLVSH